MHSSILTWFRFRFDENVEFAGSGMWTMWIIIILKEDVICSYTWISSSFGLWPKHFKSFEPLAFREILDFSTKLVSKTKSFFTDKKITLKKSLHSVSIINGLDLGQLIPSEFLNHKNGLVQPLHIDHSKHILALAAKV